MNNKNDLLQILIYTDTEQKLEKEILKSSSIQPLNSPKINAQGTWNR